MQKLIYLPLLQNAQENEQNCVDALRCFHHKSCTHPCHPRRSRPMSWENCPFFSEKSLILLVFLSLLLFLNLLLIILFLRDFSEKKGRLS
mgnify:CR=1 FL=1